jgi:hypothetical protein
MGFFARPALAVAFGAFILCAETCLHFEEITHPASWIDLPIHDWLAGVFLVWSGLKSRRAWNWGRPYQAAAWAFMASLLLGAFVSHWEEWTIVGSADAWATAFVGTLAVLLVMAVGGLVGTLTAGHSATHQR